LFKNNSLISNTKQGVVIENFNFASAQLTTSNIVSVVPGDIIDSRLENRTPAVPLGTVINADIYSCGFVCYIIASV
jgi:hypothetical protein